MEFDPQAWPWALAAFGLYLIFLLLNRRRPPPANLAVPALSPLMAAQRGPKVLIQRYKPWLRLLAFSLICLALARPRSGEQAVQSYQPGMAIMMILDKSSSMLDPMLFLGQEETRLDIVKAVFADFVLGDHKGLAGRSNDRIGLISFAGFADEISPLTTDHQSLVHFAQGIEPAARYEDGTMIGDALHMASLRMISYQALLGRQGEAELAIKSKIMILLTDGQQTPGGLDPKEAAKLAQANGIKLYSIAIVSDPSPGGMLGNLFRLNNPILDTRLIEEASHLTGGEMFKVSTGEALIEVYKKIDELEKTPFAEKRMVYQEYYATPLAFGLFLLALELTLSLIYLKKID